MEGCQPSPFPRRVGDATSPAGALVNYAGPAAADSCTVRSVACAACRAALCKCTVADFANHTASCSFTVKVMSPTDQAADLITKINRLSDVSDGIKNRVVSKLYAASRRSPLEARPPRAPIFRHS